MNIMPAHLQIQNDKIIYGEIIEKIGYEYESSHHLYTSEMINLNNEEYFPFTRLCLSIGDWAIVSSLPEMVKKKYPHIKFLLPDEEWINYVFKNSKEQWKFGDLDPAKNIELIFKNNPFVDGYFTVGQFNTVYTDHDRIYRYKDEPLIAQIMRYFGFTESEINVYHSAPTLYFSEEEEKYGNMLATMYTDIEFANNEHPFEYIACGLFSSRIKERFNAETFLKDYPHFIDSILQNLGKIEDQYVIFYYADNDFEDNVISYLKEMLPDHSWINFKNAERFKDPRMQLYIKSQAKYNFGLQSGFTDASNSAVQYNMCRFNDVATHYENIGDNAIRSFGEFGYETLNVKYFKLNGSIEMFK